MISNINITVTVTETLRLTSALLKTLCGQHEDVRIVSTDNTMVIELNVLDEDVPGRRFFEGRYYQCKSSYNLLLTIRNIRNFKTLEYFGLRIITIRIRRDTPFPGPGGRGGLPILRSRWGRGYPRNPRSGRGEGTPFPGPDRFVPHPRYPRVPSPSRSGPRSGWGGGRQQNPQSRTGWDNQPPSI